MRALICGISGQDGSYLAQLLLNKGYQVFGTSRDPQGSTFANLAKLGIQKKIEVLSMDLTDFRSVLIGITKTNPDEIYNLAGQTSVGLSFEQPVEAMESISIGTLNLLEAIRFQNPKIRYYNAGSSECFGDTGGAVATEETPFQPRSPYGVAKATSHFLVQNYRMAYQLFVSTGILFNHESPLRPTRFVTQKIISAAARIHTGSNEKLQLGNLSISRDWGWAPDYVEAMWRILQQQTPDDFIIATGRTTTLLHFVERAFAHFGLHWRDHTEIREHLKRPSDIDVNCGDPSKAARVLGWTPTKHVDEVIHEMCEAARRKLQ